MPDVIKKDISRDELRTEQMNDPTLEKICKMASENGNCSDNGKANYIKKNGLVFREFKSSTVDDGRLHTQLVVPKPHRETVMRLAHDSILGAHLGTRKTVLRVLSEFYWPGVQADTRRFCQSCDICQRTTSKGKTVQVPLQKMPLIDEPFQRVAVDLVGPIQPATTKGNRYILTLVDYGTRFPKAVPLSNIETERVAEALVDIFCRVGVPREMLSDMGTQFTSGLMSKVSCLVSRKHLTTTPYHPICNGLAEKFNGTLKQMLRRLCHQKPKDWDKYINAALFAYCEVPQESLGFSPFELVYGRHVRGPMTILKELWTNEVADSEVKSTYQYVTDLREKLELTSHMARENLRKAASRYCKYYNRKTRTRSMKVGDKVLVLLPTDSNKLLMQWKGPFPITEKLGTVDYRIDMHGVQKTFHADLLKLYVSREL